MTSRKAPAPAPTTSTAVNLPMSALTPKPAAAAAWLGIAAASVAITALRPAKVPAAVQKAADVTTGIILTAHPLEAAYVNRRLKSYDVTPATRRRLITSTLVFGALAWPDGLKAVDAASR